MYCHRSSDAFPPCDRKLPNPHPIFSPAHCSPLPIYLGIAQRTFAGVETTDFIAHLLRASAESTIVCQVFIRPSKILPFGCSGAGASILTGSIGFDFLTCINASSGVFHSFFSFIYSESWSGVSILFIY